MTKRSLIKEGNYSVYDVNKLLDELNLSESDEKPSIITKIIRKFSSIEQKWLIRIILKDLKIGISDKLVLTQYHIDAIEYLNVNSNLKKLCDSLKDPNSRYCHMSISLFTPVRPMLASRYIPSKISQIFSGKEFAIEEKLDGERIQIHKMGDQVKIFTRNSNDATTIYESFIPIVKKHILSDEVIIDGELLIWDSILGKKEPFGKLKSFAASSSSSDDQSGLHYGKNYLYVAFDVLFVKGESVMDLPYHKRHDILRRCIDVKENVIEIIKQVKGTQLNDIINALDIAVELRQEGIMIKDLESSYIPNERKEKWIKLKPEYIDGIGDDLDLIIMGGYYGTGYRKGGTISQFLLGLKKSDKLFYSMCRVGSGFTDSELKNIQTMLKSFWKPFDLHRPPDCYRFHSHSLKDKPDVWIHPTHSKIIQVKASQIIPTDKYMAGYTLRFPRIIKLRTDKNWNECMDYNEFIEMARQSEGFLSKRKYNQSTGECSLNVKRRKTVSNEVKYNNMIENEEIKIESQLFKGLKFCVLGGDEELSKQEVEKLIQSHSGIVTPLPTDDIIGVISSKKTIRVSNIINKGDIDVILVRWIKSCISNKRVLSIEPRHVIYAKKETRDRFEKDLDIYGDSYETDIPCDGLKEIFQSINHIQMNNEPIDLIKLDYKTLNVPWWGMFRGKIMYLDQYLKVSDKTTKINLSSFEILERFIQFYGGSTDHHITASITEIIIDKNDLSRLNEIKKEVKRIKLDCAIVSKEWIINSIKEKQLNDYEEFIIK